MQKIQVIITYVLLAISIGIIGYVFAQKEATQSRIEQERRQDIVLNDLANFAPVTIGFAEKPIVLLLFTSWCPYCNEDAPKIVQLENKYKDSIQVVGINLLYRDELEDVRDYVANHKITYPILLDDTGDIHRRYGNDGFPALYFIDSKGNVIDRIIGSADLDFIEHSFINLQERFV